MTDYELDLLYAESLNGGTPLTDFEEVAVWVRGILTPSNTEASRGWPQENNLTVIEAEALAIHFALMDAAERARKEEEQ